MTTRERTVTAALGKAIAQQIGEPRYRLWFQHTKFRWNDEQLTVGVANHFFQEWLQNTFAEAVREAATAVLGRPMSVAFAIDPELFQEARQAQEQVKIDEAAIGATDGSRPSAPASRGATATRGPRPPREPAAKKSPSSTKRRWRRLADFVAGPENRVAFASAQSVAEAPAEHANPLVLHGPLGTGKTHLLEGIYAGIRKSRPDWTVCYIAAEDWTNRFVQAVRTGKLAAFRKRFRGYNALLVDDLGFLAGKRATQEEFLHTFDALLAQGRQLAFTCDCHPKLADELTPELLDRIMGGAVWGLTPPEAKTRKLILQVKAREAGTALPDNVAAFISQNLGGNVRELEGALQTLRHYAHVTGKAIDLALAREALSDLLRHSVRVLQIRDIDRVVCRVLNLEAGDLRSDRRSWAVSHPRMLAMYLARRHTSAAYSDIGRYFGGRNHSTAIAAEKKVRRWMQTKEEIALGGGKQRVCEVLEAIERKLLR